MDLNINYITTESQNSTLFTALLCPLSFMCNHLAPLMSPCIRNPQFTDTGDVALYTHCLSLSMLFHLSPQSESSVIISALYRLLSLSPPSMNSISIATLNLIKSREAALPQKATAGPKSSF